ncbi:LysR family transcriptional regulator [Streptomyces sp. KPB2]|uniref:LysR family transcriptional regulator n=1 Tax=Streptomyces TaxID=1883 RepID=UPI000F6B7963|nr:MULTISPECIES: LysR family transcriptional regulator [Streptomyces]WST99734.1 LysR family transcriptional regulator [Streptomyces sp. NBC_01124]AZM74057.1 LysR family transcriptional regulator [Streptomyces sp. KPB2]MBH5129774.1 LysR family transcriptional regulator [Streptomyces sp. HB-N217]MDU0257829.1 LysR family transcriptional regulator [Streptomyces sp. PU10]QKW59548.1 LysR family transcriptional regulator [Streptomyces sp. NA03103]
MESRALRYFVAVAEELNFARAAERLGISPPPLSRAIRRLEAELGVTLFERTTHSVTRTPAGDVLLAEARVALDALEAAGRRARRAAEEPKLVLAVKADGDAGLLEPILARYAAEPGSVPVAVRLCGWREQPGLLRSGEADVALVHAPFDRTGLDTETLAAEPRVAVLAADHPLAARDRLELADLGLDAGSVERHIDEAARGHGDLAQVLTAASLGKVVTLLPASVTARYPRPGLAYRPVLDAPPVVLALAWPQQSRSTATAALVRTATEIAEAARAGT